MSARTGEFTVRYTTPSLVFGLERDDLIVIQPDVSAPYTVLACYPMPGNYEAIIAELKGGFSELVTEGQSLPALTEALRRRGLLQTYRPPRNRPRSGPALQLVHVGPGGPQDG